MTEQQEREAFEAHMRSLGYHGGELEQHHNGHYWNDEVSAAWIAWQARTALAATLAAAEPLTVTRLLDLMPDSIPARHDRELIDFARAVERAHGIGASTKEASK